MPNNVYNIYIYIYYFRMTKTMFENAVMFSGR